ncbi:MAG: tetraacyldisaccharide 4'-kinase, partial [Moraxellaceae bacterium]
MITSTPNIHLQPIRFILGISVFVLASCTHPASKSSVVSTAPQRPVWEMPVDSEAKSYLSECETDYKKVAAELESFTGLKSITDLALLDKLNKMDMVSDRQMSRAGLYSSVHPNKEVRSAAETCEQHFVEVNTDISLSRAIYDKLNKVNVTTLSAEDKRYVEHMLRDYHHSGVDKDQATRDQIKKLSEEINLVGQQFDKNYREGGKTIEVASIK